MNAQARMEKAIAYHVKVEQFRFSALAAATSNFAADNRVGSNRSGEFFIGSIPGGPKAVITRIVSGDPEEVLRAELAAIPHPRPKNFHNVLGWCIHEGQHLLVTQHMVEGSLYNHIHGSRASPVTPCWRRRILILHGAASAIHYLHDGLATRIVHRKLHSGNVLLDEEFRPHVTHLAFSARHGQQDHEAVGTDGYLDPEYRRTRRATTASDVYTLGVLILEVMTGLDPRTREGDVLQAIRDDEEGLPSMLDRRPAVADTRAKLRALELLLSTAKDCLKPQGNDRPPVLQVVKNLQKALDDYTSG